jgi:hypothetical protein
MITSDDSPTPAIDVHSLFTHPGSSGRLRTFVNFLPVTFERSDTGLADVYPETILLHIVHV